MIIKKIQNQLFLKEQELNLEINTLKKKISLITNNDLDFLDMLYREKLRYGTKNEIIIKIKWVKLDTQKKLTNL